MNAKIFFTVAIFYYLVTLSWSDGNPKNANEGVTEATSPTPPANGGGSFNWKQIQQNLQKQAIKVAQRINENVPDSWRKYGDLPASLLEKISLQEVTQENFLIALSETITEALLRGMHETADIPPLELSSKSKYVCGGKGRASKMTSLQQVRNSVVNNGDFLDLHIVYKFGTFECFYEKFYIKIIDLVKLDGRLEMKFGENEIEVVLTVPKFKKMVNNLFTRTCIVRLKDLNALKLEYGGHTLSAESHVRRGVITSQLDAYLKEHEDVLKKQFEAQTLQEVRRSLSSSGDWICNDQQMADLVLKKGGSLDAPKYLPSFFRHCV